MKRSILACLAGLLTWIVVVTVVNGGLRLSLPNYTAAEQALQFTLGMKWARLLIASVTSVVAGVRVSEDQSQRQLGPSAATDLVQRVEAASLVAIRFEP